MLLANLFEATPKAPKVVSAASPEDLKPGEIVDFKIVKFKEKLGKIDSAIADLESGMEQTASMMTRPEVKKKKELLKHLRDLHDELAAKINEMKQQAEIEKAATIPPDLRNLMDTIAKECSVYLAGAKKAADFLYHGKKGRPAAYRGRSREDRKPKDSDRLGQELFDQLLSKCGAVALRSNSIFCAEAEQAEEYGPLYVIFPIDGKNAFTYGDTPDLVINDITDIPGFNYDLFASARTKLMAAVKTNENLSENFRAKLLNFIRNNLQSFYVRPEFSNYLPFLEKAGIPPKLYDFRTELFVTLKSFKRSYNPRFSDYSLPIYHGGEVYITGEYYALSVKSFGKIISNYFKIPVRR